METTTRGASSLKQDEYLVTLEGEQLKIQVLDSSRVSVNDKVYHYDFVEAQSGEYSLLLDGKTFTVSISDYFTEVGSERLNQSLSITLNNRDYLIDVDDKRSLLLKSLQTGELDKSGTHVLQSPMPGLVVKVEVQEGEDVEIGQGLIILEAMKMENELKATGRGKITSVHVAAGAKVEKGERLLTISQT